MSDDVLRALPLLAPHGAEHARSNPSRPDVVTVDMSDGCVIEFLSDRSHGGLWLSATRVCVSQTRGRPGAPEANKVRAPLFRGLWFDEEALTVGSDWAIELALVAYRLSGGEYTTICLSNQHGEIAAAALQAAEAFSGSMSTEAGKRLMADLANVLFH
jgi:hypothetical protein